MKQMKYMKDAGKDVVREYCFGCKNSGKGWDEIPCLTCTIEIEISHYEKI